MNYFEFIVENWALLLATLVVVLFIIHFVYRWLQKPRAAQIADMKEWLKFAVVEAEKKLGSGTGELKLRTVYDKAVVLFPWVAVFISFEQFNEYVKEALDWMEAQLESNAAIAAYVGR